MKNGMLFQKIVIYYVAGCYLLLLLTLGFIVMYGGGGHGPFVYPGWFLTILFCLVSFPASLITLFGFMTGGDSEVIITLLDISPFLNGMFIGWYLYLRKRR